jgi:hypothetical protein
MDQWRHLQREWGTSVQPLKKPILPTVLAHRQFMDKNNLKQTRFYWKKYVNGSEYSKGHKKI